MADKSGSFQEEQLLAREFFDATEGLLSAHKTGLGVSAEILSVLLDRLPVMIAVYGSDGRLQCVNHEFELCLGYSATEWNESDALAQCFPDSVELARARTFFWREASYHQEFVMRTRNGRSIHTVWQQINLSDGSGIAIGQDQTQAKEAKRRIQWLSRRLLEVQEDERRHLARELHDEIGQQLTGLLLRLRQTDLAGAETIAKELAGQVRNLSLRLRPTMLDDLGLLHALLWLFSQLEKQAGLRVRFTHRGLENRFEPELETAVFRIVQEALTNVTRYAQVSEAEVTLNCQDGLLSLEVRDNGIGFDVAEWLSREPTAGLSGMRERAELLGGSWEIHTTPGVGTTVRASLPATLCIPIEESFDDD